MFSSSLFSRVVSAALNNLFRAGHLIFSSDWDVFHFDKSHAPMTDVTGSTFAGAATFSPGC